MRLRGWAVLVLALFMTSCSGEVPVVEEVFTPVEVYEVSMGTIRLTNIASGVIVPNEEVSLTPKVPGKISTMTAKQGDQVTAGSVLATIEGQDLDNQISNLKAQISQQQAALPAASSQIETAKNGVESAKKQAETEKENIRLAEASIISAQTGVKTAAANLEAAKATLRNSQTSTAQAASSKQQSITAASAEIASAERARDLAMNNLATTKDNHEKNTNLKEEGIISEQTFIDSANAVVSAEKILADANARLEDAKKNLEIINSRPDTDHESVASAQVKTAEVAYEQARNAVETANVQKAQAQKRQEQSEFAITQAEQAVKTAEAQKAQVEAAIATLTTQLSNMERDKDKYEITTPISGTIMKKNLSVGEMSGQSPLYVIADMSRVFVEANVTEKTVNAIKPGDEASISVIALGGAAIKGRIDTISPSQDAQRPGFVVRILLDKAAAGIKTGMFARVEFVTLQKRNVITVPVDAVMSRGEEEYVYTIDEGIAKRAVVTLGEQDNTNIEITGGISRGTQIVVRGQEFLSEDEKVNVVKTTTGNQAPNATSVPNDVLDAFKGLQPSIPGITVPSQTPKATNKPGGGASDILEQAPPFDQADAPEIPTV